jgi:hypothetical protein
MSGPTVQWAKARGDEQYGVQVDTATTWARMHRRMWEPFLSAKKITHDAACERHRPHNPITAQRHKAACWTTQSPRNVTRLISSFRARCRPDNGSITFI